MSISRGRLQHQALSSSVSHSSRETSCGQFKSPTSGYRRAEVLDEVVQAPPSPRVGVGAWGLSCWVWRSARGRQSSEITAPSASRSSRPVRDHCDACGPRHRTRDLPPCRRHLGRRRHQQTTTASGTILDLGSCQALVVRPSVVKLPRFRGHPLTGGDGAHDAKEATATSTVPA